MVGMYAVKGSNHFIMPLLFNEESQDLSPESKEDTVKPSEPIFKAFQRGEETKNQERFSKAEKAKQKDPSNKNTPPVSVEDQEAQSQSHKSGIAHFVLAIAEKVNRDQSSVLNDTIAKKTLVRLRFMDSSKGSVNETIILRVARNIVRNSGWLGDTWPCFNANEKHWTEVLRQSGNGSGEHTVMNAWAYMLEIPLASIRGRGLGPKTYIEVRKMNLLALQGQLDSLTIRAWMQHYKYAVDEPLSQLQQTQIHKSDSPNQLKNMQTVALNEDTFNEKIREMHTQAQVEQQNHATFWKALSVPLHGNQIQIKIQSQVLQAVSLVLQTCPLCYRLLIHPQDPGSKAWNEVSPTTGVCKQGTPGRLKTHENRLHSYFTHQIWPIMT